MNNLEKLKEVQDLMMIGQWSDATILFQSINCSATDYSNFIGNLESDDGYNFCMIGFYAREFKPKGK